MRCAQRRTNEWVDWNGGPKWDWTRNNKGRGMQWVEQMSNVGRSQTVSRLDVFGSQRYCEGTERMLCAWLVTADQQLGRDRQRFFPERRME